MVPEIEAVTARLPPGSEDAWAWLVAMLVESPGLKSRVNPVQDPTAPLPLETAAPNTAPLLTALMLAEVVPVAVASAVAECRAFSA